MKETNPSPPPASEISASALARAASVAWPSKPEPGTMTLPAMTVTKITGPVIGLDQLDERVGQPLGLLGRAGRDEPEHDARGDPHQHEEPLTAPV